MGSISPHHRRTYRLPTEPAEQSAGFLHFSPVFLDRPLISCSLRIFNRHHPPMTPDPNDNKIMTKRIQAADSSTVILNYPRRDAQELRALASSFTLKAGKKASLSLLSRRSLQLYSRHLSDPANRASEAMALNEMVTPTPAPASHSKRAPAA